NDPSEMGCKTAPLHVHLLQRQGDADAGRRQTSRKGRRSEHGQGAGRQGPRHEKGLSVSSRSRRVAARTGPAGCVWSQGSESMSELNRRQMMGAAAVAAGGLVAAAGRAEDGAKEEELPTFRYPMEQQKGRVSEGGSAKEATVKQLPISTGLAGVSMRLGPGGIRELHWHANAADGAFVLKSPFRTTALGPDNLAALADVIP